MRLFNFSGHMSIQYAVRCQQRMGSYQIQHSQHHFLLICHYIIIIMTNVTRYRQISVSAVRNYPSVFHLYLQI